MAVVESPAICPDCGSAARETANFCNQCGRRLRAPRPAPTCARGHRLEPEWSGCPFCRDDLPDRPLLARALALAAAGKPLPRELLRPLADDESQTQEVAPGRIAGVLATFSKHPRGQAFLIKLGRNMIGAGNKATARLADPTLAEEHAAIEARGGGLLLRPVEGAAVRHNGAALEGEAELRHGDLIQTGAVLWRFAQIEAPNPTGGFR